MMFEQGTTCWIADDAIGWKPATVKKLEYDGIAKKYRIELEYDDNPNETYTIETANLTESNTKFPQLRNLDDTVNDLTSLSHLNEPSVLNSVRLRYFKQMIYTFSGVVLIAINPFQRIDNLYTHEQIKRYWNKNMTDNPPHVFSIADEAFKLMRTTSASQSIIVSGESGAGKTVSAKYIMRFLAYAHADGTSSETTEIERQILATNPIMEAFGNAKTTRNDNSSRFGKYLRISFDDRHLISGAKIQTYLLERTRLVNQAENERNFHIFYQMVNGLPDVSKQEFSLTKCEDYSYLNGGHTSTVKGVNDANEFQITRDALKVIGIGENLQHELFKLLAALLHIGNIKIENLRSGAHIASDESNLLLACKLLGINPKEFCKWLIKKKISTRSENIASSSKYHEALVARDSVSKHIYSILFDWLVRYINADLSPPESMEREKTFIGVLDIYGFEHFVVNSFEQFCINYANEKLQQEFTHHVFKLQQDEYVEEGIEWSFIKFSDNQPCIDLIESRDGILSLLDEQCKLPSGSDKAWADKMFQNLTKPPYSEVFKKGRFGDEKFIVSHYALDVTYEVNGFLEKNKDMVPDALNEVLMATENAFLRDILTLNKESENAGADAKRKSWTRNKKPTLGHIFKISLNELMKTINGTNAHYIRCIKPNEEKVAWKFDNLMVLSQLRACGVLETIRISLVGFPSKYTYEEFLQRFRLLLSLNDQKELLHHNGMDDCKKLAIKLLKNMITDHTSFQTGLSKIFFRSGVLGQLEVAKSNKLHQSVVTIQKNVRCFLGRKRWLEARQSIIAVQSYAKGALVRAIIADEKEKVICIQALFRGFIARERFISILNATIAIQSMMRGYQSRLKYSDQIAAQKEQERKRKEEMDRLKAIEEEELLKKRLEEERLRELEVQKRLEEEERLRKLDREKRHDEEEERLKRETARLVAEESKKRELTRKANENTVAKEARILKGKKSLETIYHPNSDSPVILNLASPSANLINNIKDDVTVDELLSCLSDELAPLKYTYNDFLGMKPQKAISVITRAVLLRTHNIAAGIDAWKLLHPDEHYQDVTLTSRLQSNMLNDVKIMKKMLRRVKYTKPEVVNKRMSLGSVRSISAATSKVSSSETVVSDLDRNLKVGHSDLVDYVKGSTNAIDCLAELILKDLAPPVEDLEKPCEIGEVLMPARLITNMLKDYWLAKTYSASARFLDKTLTIFKDQLESLGDPDSITTMGAYLLINVNEVRFRISWARYCAMSDFDSDNFHSSEERHNHLRLLLIMKRYCDTIFGQMYHTWIINIFDQIKKKAIGAVATDRTMMKMRKDPQTYFRNVLYEGPKYKMTNLIEILRNVHLAMKSYYFEEEMIKTITQNLLTYIDVLSFNSIITKESYLTAEEGLLIKNNISIIIDWCKNSHIGNSPNTLIHVLTLCQILQLKGTNMADVDMVSKTCDSLTTAQIARILGITHSKTEVDGASMYSDEEGETLTDVDLELIMPLEPQIYENPFLSTI
jgi:myosin V